MKKLNTIVLIGLAIFLSCSSKNTTAKSTANTQEIISTNQINKGNMKLGAFSISLSVKDLATSKAFYENLGFEVLGGDMKMNYLIMKNENALIGLFQGMFEGNILTFNPGWDENAKEVNPFDDVRKIEQHLKEKGVQLDTEVKPNTTGPGSMVFKDPDGNVILIDQHR